MLNTRALLCALAVALLGGGRLCVGAETADSGLPLGITASTAQLLRINGLDVLSRALTSALSPDDACALLERQWQSNCRRVGEWLLISHRVGRVLQTAQLETKGRGSVGFLSMVDPLTTPSARLHAQLPLPAGARVVNVVQSIEAGDSVTQFTLLLPMSPAAVLQRLRSAARDRGWDVAEAGDGSVIDFQRGAVAARTIAIGTPQGTTLVLIEHQPTGAQQ